jgi:hypothetical protein
MGTKDRKYLVKVCSSDGMGNRGSVCCMENVFGLSAALLRGGLRANMIAQRDLNTPLVHGRQSGLTGQLPRDEEEAGGQSLLLARDGTLLAPFKVVPERSLEKSTLRASSTFSDPSNILAWRLDLDLAVWTYERPDRRSTQLTIHARIISPNSQRYKDHRR